MKHPWQSRAVKTFLIAGVETELSESLCLELARRDRRLLVAGRGTTQLELLDATLVQNELHRYHVGLEGGDLAEWSKTQRIGLDGLVLFPPLPTAAQPILLAPEALQALTSVSLLAPIEVIRRLLPQLERGKKPKSILVVLDWQQPDPSPIAAWVTVLKQAWRSCVRELAHELAGSGLVINALYPGNLYSDQDPSDAAGASAGELPEVDRPPAAEAGLPGGVLRVQDAARAAAQLLDDAAPTQSGQFLELGIPA
jgi:NAD(P)-dependent dehydrogenase (short-subunit alcohol dehydrogenase family)